MRYKNVPCKSCTKLALAKKGVLFILQGSRTHTYILPHTQAHTHTHTIRLTHTHTHTHIHTHTIRLTHTLEHKHLVTHTQTTHFVQN